MQQITKTKRNKGFTLIEIVLTLVLMGILSAMAGAWFAELKLPEAEATDDSTKIQDMVDFVRSTNLRKNREHETSEIKVVLGRGLFYANGSESRILSINVEKTSSETYTFDYRGRCTNCDGKEKGLIVVKPTGAKFSVTYKILPTGIVRRLDDSK